MKKNNVATVFRWEFLKHIKSPVFILFTFFIPVIIILAGVLPGFIAGQTHVAEKDLWVLDETEALAPLLQTSFADSRYNLQIVEGDLEELKEDIDAGEAEGLLHLTQQTLDAGQSELYAQDTIDFSRNELEQLIQPTLMQHRLQALEISPEEFSSILLPTSVRLFSVTGEEDATDLSFLIPMVLGLFLFMAIIFSGQIMMQSVIKEKRNRVIEILLSSLSATELLAGKILAFGALTLVQTGLWLGAGVIAAAQFIDLRELGIDYGQLLMVLPYFIFGYLLFATIFAATASTMKDAESGSQAHGLVIMVPMIPMFVAPQLMMDPNGLFARIFSYIPIFTPATMLMRLGATQVPVWEIVLTALILLVSMFFFLKIGARIYQGSLLKFDSAASIKDIIKMARK